MALNISRILLAPIKGFPQLSIAPEISTPIGPSGKLGIDRHIWFQFSHTDVVVAGKSANRQKKPQFYRIQAEFNSDLTTVRLSLPAADTDGVEVYPDTIPLGANRALIEWVSEAMQKSVTIHRDEQIGRPDDLDLKSFTFVSEASIAKIGEWFELSIEEVIARLRPTLVIDGLDAFEEFRFLGQDFQIGNSRFSAVQACLRCSVPEVCSKTGERTSGFQKRFGQLMRPELVKWAPESHRREEHGYYACINTKAVDVDASASVKLGDELVFLG